MEFGTPVHLAVIPDGNGRWAEHRGLERVAGHTVGFKKLVTFAKWCADDPRVSHLSAFVFSKENWARPRVERAHLFDLLTKFLVEDTTMLRKEHGVVTVIIGDLDDDRLPESLTGVARPFHDVDPSVDIWQLRFGIFFNYSGEWEIAQALKSQPRLLVSRAFPDPDLLLRLGGEQRLSNFLLPRLAYTELFFISAMWPDISEELLEQVLYEYTLRRRRFGLAGVNEDFLSPP